MTYKFLRGEQVAELLNISRSAVYNLMRRGVIPSLKVGHSVRVRPEDLQQFIERNLVSGEIQPTESNNHIEPHIHGTVDTEGGNE